MTDLEHHAFADLFPATSDSQLAELAADIAANGLREPIVLHHGKILDGRARYRACRMAGIEPRFETFAGDDPMGFVVKMNLARHNLSPDQRAMIASELAELMGRIGQRKAKRKSSDVTTARRVDRKAALSDRYKEFDALMDDARQCLKEIALSSALHTQMEELARCHLAYLQTMMQEYRQMYVDRPPKTPDEILAARNERGVKQLHARCDRCIHFNSEWLATANYIRNIEGSK